ncbi:MAG: hypothetical protein ABII07_02405 [Patescibacteria group bacterium]|nr:hypothetical protein [Patescibacteria group bacterium]
MWIIAKKLLLSYQNHDILHLQAIYTTMDILNRKTVLIGAGVMALASIPLINAIRTNQQENPPATCWVNCEDSGSPRVECEGGWGKDTWEEAFQKWEAEPRGTYPECWTIPVKR